MTGSLNRVCIIGNLGSAPEGRSFNNGGRVVNFSVAVNESWKDRHTGETKERTEWVKVAVFHEATANFAEKYLSKGSKVYVEGKLQTRKWQNREGQDQYTTEVVLQGFEGKLISLDSRPSGGGQGQQSSGGAVSTPGGSTDWQGNDLGDEDIPF